MSGRTTVTRAIAVDLEHDRWLRSLMDRGFSRSHIVRLALDDLKANPERILVPGDSTPRAAESDAA